MINQVNKNIFSAKLIKALLLFAALLLLLFAAVLRFSSDSVSVDLPSCSAVSDPVAGVNCIPDCANLTGDANPYGTVNCFYLGLPPCSSIADASNRRHRDNCADLIDLPLASDIDPVGTNPPLILDKKNSVHECKDLSNNNAAAYNSSNNRSLSDYAAIVGNNLIKYIDFAVPRRDCVRFTDDAGVVAGSAPASDDYSSINATDPRYDAQFTPCNHQNKWGKYTYCEVRKCHQLPDNVKPIPSGSGKNCDLMACNLLTADELNSSKIRNNRTWQFCDGSTVKCFDSKFTINKIPNLVRHSNNIDDGEYPLCQIHHCKSVCGPDDIGIINARGDSYANAYKAQFNGNMSFENSMGCEPVTCRPIVYRQTFCQDGVTPSDCDKLCVNSTTNDYSNTICTSDSECPSGSTCRPQTCTGSNSICTKRIDCNLAANSRVEECMGAAIGPDDTNTDPTNAWFYRPKPMNKALNTSTGKLLPMRRDLCYSLSNIISQSGSGWDVAGLTWWNYETLPSRSFSPGACGLGNTATARGIGYINLCGTGGNRNTIASDYSGYFKGYVSSSYITSNNASAIKNNLTICLRFKSTTPPGLGGVCGKRECAMTCSYSDVFDSGRCTTKNCGIDDCTTLTVSNDESCAIEADGSALFSGNPNRDCSTTYDKLSSSPIRVRAVKYGHRICAFIDQRGATAYSNNFFDGNEKISDTGNSANTQTCVSGNNDGTGKCVGSQNTNANQGDFMKYWRTVRMIPYIQNALPVGKTPSAYPQGGYFDFDNKFFKAQECAAIPLRASPPQLYNTATVETALRLFTPPLYIFHSYIKKGGDFSLGSDGNYLGPTDFNYPAIDVMFGSDYTTLSLDIGQTGYESESEATNFTQSKASDTLRTTISGTTYSVDVFIRKEYNEQTKIPLLCLYRKVRNDLTGGFLDPVRVGCVNRNFPDIKNTVMNRRIAIAAPVSPAPLNTYNNSAITLKYCQGSTCTNLTSISNLDPDTPSCKRDLENYQICAQRDPCSRLNVECTQNEINLQNALAQNQNINQFLGVRNECINYIAVACDLKKGITTSGTTYDNAYGWYNEICITKGFEPMLKEVVAYKVNNGSIAGRCVLNVAGLTTKQINDCNCGFDTSGASAATINNCIKNGIGGGRPGCPCVEYVYDPITRTDNVDAETQLHRRQTPREAGLCIDMPLPQLCPVIQHNQHPKTGSSDSAHIDYVLSSVNNTRYGDPHIGSSNATDEVDISHKYRTFGKDTAPQIPIAGHAEFPAAVFGMTGIQGECRGFWQYYKNAQGTFKPTMSCLNDNGAATWDLNNISNPCVRYYCPMITTGEPSSISGVYVNNYADNESDRGLSNGFAVWPQHNLDSDFPEVQSAMYCLTGYRPFDATTKVRSAGKITGYTKADGTSGTLPTRLCNQIGVYQADITNSCQRIICPAINPTTMAELFNNGGASFPAAKASRRTTNSMNRGDIEASESVSLGTCDTSNGFHQMPGEDSLTRPYRFCDRFGNWGPVINPCTTTCTAVSADTAANPSNGYATWSASNITATTADDGTTTYGYTEVPSACLATYDPYPYPPAKQSDGITAANNPVSLAAINSYTPTSPKRRCIPEYSASGVSSSWTAPDSRCVNFCPGGEADDPDADPRINVGITRHAYSGNSDGSIDLIWHKTEYGQWDTLYSSGSQNATQYNKDRTNGNYIVRRFCNNITKRWDEPVAACVAANGQIGNANYPNPSNAGDLNMEHNAFIPTSATSYPASGTSPSNTSVGQKQIRGVCVAGFWSRDGITTETRTTYTNDATAENDIGPLTECVLDDGETRIDKTYWKVSDGYKDCVQVTCPDETINSADGRATYDAAVTTYTNGNSYSAQCTINKTVEGSDPTISCQSDGTWSTIADSDHCKIGCDIPAVNNLPNFVASDGWSGNSVRVNDCCSGWGMRYYFGAFSLKHGTSISFNAFDKNGGGCTGWYFGVTCDNGTYRYSSEIVHDWNPGEELPNCYRRTYNQTTNSFGDYGDYLERDTVHISNSCNYLDKNGNAQTFTMTKDYANPPNQCDL